MWCHWRFYCRNRSERGYQVPPRPAGDVPLHGACALWVTFLNSQSSRFPDTRLPLGIMWGSRALVTISSA